MPVVVAVKAVKMVRVVMVKLSDAVIISIAASL